MWKIKRIFTIVVFVTCHFTVPSPPPPAIPGDNSNYAYYQEIPSTTAYRRKPIKRNSASFKNWSEYLIRWIFSFFRDWNTWIFPQKRQSLQKCRTRGASSTVVAVLEIWYRVSNSLMCLRDWLRKKFFFFYRVKRNNTRRVHVKRLNLFFRFPFQKERGADIITQIFEMNVVAIFTFLVSFFIGERCTVRKLVHVWLGL